MEVVTAQPGFKAGGTIHYHCAQQSYTRRYNRKEV